jgi:hypothetical protein
VAYKKKCFLRLVIILNLIIISITIAVVPAFTQEKKVIRVLFIGSSTTYTNNMPIWVTELSKNLGSVPQIEVTDRTVSSARLRDHLKDTYWGGLGAIRKGGWDIVVLQGYRQEPLDEPEQFFMAAAKLAEEVRATAAEPLFFQTYAYQQGYYAYEMVPCLGGNTAEMQMRISTAYAKAAEQAGTRVARVGDAWLWVLNNNPEIKLYSSDMVHPSACGSYLMACIFVSLFTGNDPREATWIPSVGVTEAEAKVLRAVAYKVCGNYEGDE